MWIEVCHLGRATIGGGHGRSAGALGGQRAWLVGTFEIAAARCMRWRMHSVLDSSVRAGGARFGGGGGFVCGVLVCALLRSCDGLADVFAMDADDMGWHARVYN